MSNYDFPQQVRPRSGCASTARSQGKLRTVEARGPGRGARFPPGPSLQAAVTSIRAPSPASQRPRSSDDEQCRGPTPDGGRTRCTAVSRSVGPAIQTYHLPQLTEVTPDGRFRDQSRKRRLYAPGLPEDDAVLHHLPSDDSMSSPTRSTSVGHRESGRPELQLPAVPGQTDLPCPAFKNPSAARDLDSLLHYQPLTATGPTTAAPSPEVPSLSRAGHRRRYHAIEIGHRETDDSTSFGSLQDWAALSTDTRR